MTTDSHSGTGNKTYFVVWFALVFLTFVELFFAYQHVAVVMMLVILLGASLMKSALIMAYFMHLKFERLSVTLTLIPALVILLCLMFISFPDSVRVQQLAPR
jgi:cytochrome c oxidase subunit 4